jgi:hypothetical protein
MEAKLLRIKELIEAKEKIDTELEELISGGVRQPKQRLCKKCGEPGHGTKTCPQTSLAPEN